VVVQVLKHLHIVSAGRVAAVQQLDKQADGTIRLKIAVDQIVPPLALGVGDLGVAVAGQVNKVGRINAVEVDGCRFARRGADAGQLLAVAELIDEARLADVGAARKYDFRAVTVRQLAGQTVGREEFAVVVVHGCSFMFWVCCVLRGVEDAAPPHMRGTA
jgi:hypothetical protein